MRGPTGRGLEDDIVDLQAGAAHLETALVGATPLRWLVPVGEAMTDLLDGYRDGDELRDQDGVRNGVMAPFCNRVADGRYTFGGATHDLLPGATDRTIYHGLVRTEPFTVVALDRGEERTTALLRCTALADGAATGYPFRVVVDVGYHLGPTTLGMEITGTNVGDRAAPFVAGWHPYFRLPGADVVDRLHLDVPSTTAICTGADLLPLPGDRAFAAHDGASWHPLADSVVDAAFGGLRRDGGTATTVLSDPVTGVRLELTQDRGLVHVFTGDTLARDRRASVAVEPVEAMTDAFNRPHCAGAIRLEPGEQRSFRLRVTVSAPAR